MPIGFDQSIISALLTSSYFLFAVKAAILLILVIYAIFALLVVRQVDLMGKTLITTVAPIVKFLAIINAGLSIGLILLAAGIL